MHSMRSEPVEPLARRPWVLAGLLASALFFTLQAMAIRATVPALLILPLVYLVCLLGLRHLAAWRHLAYLQVILVTAVFGHLGLLAGVGQDLGPAGLVILASWCSGRADYGLSELWAMWRVAPWTHLGMLLGCNLGMWLSGCFDQPALRHGMASRHFVLLCNVAMLTGMLLVPLCMPAIAVSGMASAVLVLTMMMLSGMSAGMLTAWWVAERLTLPRAAVLASADGRSR